MKVKLISFDQKQIRKLLNDFKKEIKSLLKMQVEFWNIGSCFLGIKGKKDIDFCVIVQKKDFKIAKKKLSEKFGNPEKESKSCWAKFETKLGKFDSDIFLSIRSNKRAKKDKLFFEKLKRNKKLRNDYEKMKVDNSNSFENYKKAKKDFYEKITNKPSS